MTTAPATTSIPLAPKEAGNLGSGPVVTIPDRPPSTITKLSRADHKLLLRKQDFLRRYQISIPKSFQKHVNAVSATLVFGQEEAGTAICIRSDGLLLTCAHCVAESAEELTEDKAHWLLFAPGQVVSAKCIAWDPRRDLALLQITAVAERHAPVGDSEAASASNHKFPAVSVAEQPPSLGAPLICVGHPGSEDLEAAQPGVKTNYDVLHVSMGAYRGICDGQDVQDNSEIGSLQHDCWTYWGHSGAPLLDRRSGELVGLHSSWDDETGIRRGVPLEAIKEFLGIENVFSN